MENVKNARPDPKPTDITDMEEKQKPKYDLPELQNALDEILKELDKYKVTTKMSNEAVYWSTLVNENLPRWALVDAIKDIAAPLRIVDVSAEEQLNQVKILYLLKQTVDWVIESEKVSFSFSQFHFHSRKCD